MSKNHPARYKTTEEIQNVFLDFYKSKDYLHYPDSGVVPTYDPTLLLVNSGMAPLKPFFNGEQAPPSNLMTNVQNCIRTNDIGSIGDSYHGTSFNMMGSWQFGPEYSKERAIELAYELITVGFGLEENLLQASVLDDSSVEAGIPGDDEAALAWQNFLPAKRILPMPPEDNFWGPAGEVGPCGPCTEVFYNRGDQYLETEDGDQPLRNGRDVEIWNAGVFMQYDKNLEGNMTPLPSKSVDGGAGLERFAMILQDAPSIHQIDRWAPVYDTIFSDLRAERETRIVSDHMRTSEILMQSGIYPGNKLASYVLRRLMRRSMSVMQQMGVSLTKLGDYQEAIQTQLPNIPGAVRSTDQTAAMELMERKSYEKILTRGEKLLAPFITLGSIDGSSVHNLHSTYGIPVDLIRECCRINGMSFPDDDYTKAAALHTAQSSQ